MKENYKMSNSVSLAIMNAFIFKNQILYSKIYDKIGYIYTNS